MSRFTTSGWKKVEALGENRILSAVLITDDKGNPNGDVDVTITVKDEKGNVFDTVTATFGTVEFAFIASFFKYDHLQ